MGIFSKLFGRGGSEAGAPPVLSNDDVESIINAYGALLARGEAGAGIIADSKELPYPKATIKLALQMAIRLTTDAQMKEQLKVAYISLADWQEAVGPKPLGTNLLKLDLNSDPVALAQSLANQDPRAVDFQRKSDAEMQDLKSELMRIGLW